MILQLGRKIARSVSSCGRSVTRQISKEGNRLQPSAIGEQPLARLRAIIKGEDGKNVFHDMSIGDLACTATDDMDDGESARKLVMAVTVAYTRWHALDAIDALEAESAPLN